MIFWIWAVEMPSAAARSLTVTPERTVAGPVGAGTSSRRSGRWSPRPRRPRWRVSRCGREAAVSMTTRRRPPSCGPALRAGHARAAGRIGCRRRCLRRAVARRRLRVAARPGALRPAPRLRDGPRRRQAPRDAQGWRQAPASRQRDAPRDWNGRLRGHALRRPRRPCRPAGARRPRRGGEPPLRDRARARGQCLLHAFSASEMGLYQGDGAPPAALWTACQSASGTVTRARKERFSSPWRAISAATQASSGQTYAPRPGARPTASASARGGVQRDELVLRAPCPAPAARTNAELES